MLRKLIYFGLIIFFGAASAVSSYDPTQPSYDPDKVYAEHFQIYFDSLKLNYEAPLGCEARNPDGTLKYEQPPVCALAADFNGDGSLDYAVLMEYIGGKFRYGNKYIDLVILYSSMEDGRPKFNILSHMGHVSDKGDINTYLDLQPAGEIKLPAGTKNLETPGINVLRADLDNGDPWSYPTVYWHQRKEKFYQLTKATD